MFLQCATAVSEWPGEGVFYETAAARRCAPNGLNGHGARQNDTLSAAHRFRADDGKERR
jgi:hypothetical protein